TLCLLWFHSSPSTITKTAPGNISPATAAAAPGTPLRSSPVMTAMLTEFRPGRVSLISSALMKSSSLSHLELRTRYSRRYATTPPPKLIAPAMKNTLKISPSGTLAAFEVAVGLAVPDCCGVTESMLSMEFYGKDFSALLRPSDYQYRHRRSIAAIVLSINKGSPCLAGDVADGGQGCCFDLAIGAFTDAWTPMH